MYMVGIWEEYGRALMPPINICLLMCPLAKQPVLPSVASIDGKGYILMWTKVPYYYYYKS